MESRMDRIEMAMEGLIRSQTQLLRAQVIPTDQTGAVQKGLDELTRAQQKTESALQRFIEENEKTRQRMEESHRHLDEKMAETTEKLNALIHVVDNVILRQTLASTTPQARDPPDSSSPNKRSGYPKLPS